MKNIVNDVDMDNIIDKIFKEYNAFPEYDIFELINDSLEQKYSLDDFTEYISSKHIIRKKLEDIFIRQNYDRTKNGLNPKRIDNIQDLV